MLKYKMDKTIFKSLLCYNLILLIIISAIVIYSFYYTFSRMYVNKIEKENLMHVQGIQEILDIEVIKNIHSLPLYYFANDINKDFTYSMHNDIRKNPVIIHRISQYIKKISDNASYIESIDIYYRNANMLLVDGHVNFMDHKTEKFIPPMWLTLFQENMDKPWITYNNNLIYVTTIPLFYDRSYKTIVAIKVSQAYMNALLSSRQITNQLLLVNADKQVLYSNSTVDSDLLHYIQNDLELDTLDMEPTNLHYTNYMISVMPSRYNNWHYISIESTKDFYAAIHQLSYTTIAISFMVLALGFFIALSLAKWMYRPYRKIITKVRKYATAYSKQHDSDHSEYTLIENTIQNLATTLETNKPVVRYNTIKSLLLRKHYYKNTPSKDLAYVNLHFHHPYVFGFIIHIDIAHAFEASDMMNLNYGIVSVLEEGALDYSCYAIYDEDCIRGIVNYDPQVTTPQKIANQMANYLYSLIDQHFYFVVGDGLVLDNEAISASYYRALEGYDYIFLYPEKRILHYHSLGLSKRKNTTRSINILYKIEQSIKAGDKKALTFLLDGIIVSLKNGDYTISFCKNTLHDVISKIHNTLIHMNLDPVDVLDCDIREDFQLLSDIDAFSEWIGHITTQITEHLSTMRNTYVPEIKEDIITFIQDNIYNDLSLDMVANTFNIRTDTFSKTFKTLFGETYSSYMKKRKIQAAKELLKTSNLTVNEIADKLGYASVAYFITLFKKEIGLTPKKYQQQHST